MVNIGKCCSPEEKVRFTTLLKKYIDVMAWSYADLKSFKPKDVQHSIPLKPDVKPYRKKQRHYNPKISGTIQARNSKD
ncbi:hypothetical protein KI387_026647, partial [Taxus chinensis]